MSPRYERLRHNLFAFGIDAISFGIGVKFFDPITVLPAFATRLGASDAMVGLLVTVFYLSWDLPQIIAGNVVARLPRKKPPLVLAAALGRPAILLFGMYLFLTGGQPLWLTLALLFIALAAMFGSDAFAALSWFDLLGRAFPPEKRGGYLSIWGVISTVGVLGVSALTGYLLGNNGPGFPYNYGFMFLAGSIGLLISFVSLSRIYEPPITDEEPATTFIPWRAFGGHLMTIWQDDRRLRNVNIARVFMVLGTMASAFYVLYATEVRGLPDSILSLFLSARTVGSLLGSLSLGRIADRFGPVRVIQVGTLLVVLSPIVAVILTLIPVLPTLGLQAMLIVLYFALGASEGVVILGYMNYVLDIAPPGQRTIYMGVSNAVSGIGVLGPLLAGWILSVSSYQVLFSAAILFCAGALALAMRLPAYRAVSSPVVSEASLMHEDG